MMKRFVFVGVALLMACALHGTVQPTGMSAKFTIDTRAGKGPILMDDATMLRFSNLWSGDASDTVAIAQDGVTLAEGLSGEGAYEWNAPSNGTYTLTHTTYTNGVKGAVEMAVFMVGDTPSPYVVVDLSGGANAVSYSVSYLSDVPTGGWTDEYKTTKLVLRRIESGSFIMGSNQSLESHRVTISKPFYMGVFEVTQKQWELVMGSNPSQHEGDMRPVECVSYNDIRGSSAGTNWPASSSVDATSFIGKLRAKTGLDGLDLPTEAQWEYACRAGMTSTYNNGGDMEDDLKTLGRYRDNQSDGRGGYSSYHTTVGLYAPNGWGLYDMHGNVAERCLDWCGSLSYGIDPVGSSSGSVRVVRGGCWEDDADGCASSSRSIVRPGESGHCVAIRLVLGVTADGDSSEDTEESLDIVYGGRTWNCVVNDDQTLTVVGASPADGDLVIPSALNGMSVTGIDDSAFEDCTDLRSVTIPDSVTYLGADSFCDSGLTNAVIGRGVNFIREWAFEGCADLLSVTIPDGVEHIGESAFEGCASLTSVTLPSGVAVVDVSAFGGCTGLESVVFEGDAPEEVGDDAFPSSATVYVSRDSAGWGVDIPGTWMGCAIRYAEPSSDVSTALYAVVDLSGGTNAVSYPVSYLDAVPAGGWTDEYKTTKLVLRRIEAGSFIMGCPTDECCYVEDATQHEVTLTKPFYVGVFEVTQRQWELVMGRKPSYFSNVLYYQTRPVECVSYNDIRGSSAGANWPASAAVDETSFLGKLRAKTGLDGLDLPTEAQWEYACRAGTTTALNNGYDLSGWIDSGALNWVGRYFYSNHNYSDYDYDYSSSCTTDFGTAAVGSYEPNAWGLYDMHGNVNEWCLDWYGSLSSAPAVDPVGLASGSGRVVCGGDWNDDAGNCCSGSRSAVFPSGYSKYSGFRLAFQFSDFSDGDVSVTNWSGKYDGAAHSISVAVTDGISNASVRYSSAEAGPYSATPPTLTDAGTYTVWCEISAPGYIPLTNSATVSISPRSVTLTSGSASKESDGAPLVDDSVTVGGDGFASGEGATYAFTGSQTAVGASDNSFTYVLNANTKASNYDITVEYGTLTVNDRTWTHVVNSDGTATLTGVSSASGEVALPSEVDGCHVTAIGDSLFAGCTGLVSVTIPSRVTAIGANAFKGCTGLGGVTIPSRVASIGEGAFSGCTGLKSVTVPSRVTEIAASTFEGCTRLESVTLRGAVTSIGGRAFSGCSGLAAFALPDALVSIGDFAFDGCTGIRDVVITDGVLSVGAGAFCGSGVTNAALGVEVRMVRERTFDGCAGLRSVTLSAGITNICAASFRDCAALTSVDVPAAVESIGESAFAGCTGLASVRFGGDAPASVGEGAFPEDAALYAIHGTDGWGVMIPGTWRGYALRYADGYRGFDVLMRGHSGIYDGTPHGVAVTVAGGVVGAQVKYALSAEGPFTSTAPAIADAGTSTVWCVVSASGYDAQTLSAEIAIAPRTVTLTSMSATKEYDGTALVCGEVAVGGDGFVSDEGAAFDVTGSRKAVGTSANTFTYALNADTRASNYEIAAMFGELTVTDRIWTYDVNADGTATLTGVSSAKGDVAIPGIVDGHRVTALGASLFAGCAGMTEVTMPSSVTAIPDNAFSGCASLVSVSIPSRVTSIGEGAFSGCAAMKSVTIPARVTRIEARTFEDCIGLETVSIPSGVAFIASDAFSGCAAIRSVSVPARAHILSAAFPDSWRAITNVAVAAGTTAVDSFAFSDSVGLETVSIPSGVASIESDAFSGCTSLAAVAIPESVASIGEFAFSGCSALVEVGLPSELTEIASSLFQDCAALASVAIPSGVETVGDYAFAGCASLEAVEMPKGLVELGESAFEGCSSLVTAAIPSGVEAIGDYAFYGCSALEEIVFAGNAPAEVGGWAFPSSATVYVSRGSTGWGVDIPGAWMGCAIEYSAPALPTVADDADATVTGDAEAGYVVTPGAGNGNVVVEIPDGVSAEKVTVVVSPDVSTVRPNGATVKVARNGHDVTAFLDVPAAVNGVINLASATVKDTIVKEALDLSKGAEIGLGDSSSPSLKTAPTRKGLVYTLREGATLDAMKDGATTVGDGQPWTPAITVKGGSSGFYSIRVDK